ncbi:hypothetical protein N752_02040 [Desulforamulus aquiferis]|nr:MFS transporter [Desulforamulus aquiferis]RYD06934.1 hypothetical protein N752_02040 [Desulforamulus aquiferis]
MSLLIEFLGGSEATVGQAWTVAPLSEVPVFALFGFFLARGKEEMILALGALVYAVRWFLFAIINNPDLIIIIQLLHGLSFGLFYMAGVSYIGKIVPPGLRASGQGLLATFGGGIAGITGALAGGLVMDLYGPKTLYFGSSVLALCAVIGFVIFLKISVNNTNGGDLQMDRFIVRGPEQACNEIQADNMDQAINQVKQRFPGKMVAADASGVIYVCQPNEDETACQMKYK